MNRIGLLLALVLFGCSPATQTSTSSATYEEDLTIYRPPVIIPDDQIEDVSGDSVVVEVEPEWDITYQLDSLLDSVAVMNQTQGFIDGYTIQVYTGSSRARATEVRKEVFMLLPGSEPAISYDLPNYKVKVGKFYHRLEAQTDFALIRDKFRNAILVPQKFRID